MTAQRLTDAQIAAALRAHLPERATPGLQMRVMETVEGTSQQRAVPTIFAPMFDADPLTRRRTLLLVAALLLALAATAAAVGAWRLLNSSPTPELSLEPPSDVAGYVDSIYSRLPDLSPVAITTLEDGTIKRRTYVDRSGTIRVERYRTADATEPDTYSVRNRDHVAELRRVGDDKVWVDSGGSISEDPRVFLLVETTPNLATGPGCVNEHDGSAAAGWHYVALEYVIGRPTHHVACPDAELWIDVETALILRGRGPAVDDAYQAIPGTNRTNEVTELTFGDQPADLFSFTKPEGVAVMPDQGPCTQAPECNASPPMLYTPPPDTSPAPPPPTVPNDNENGWIAYVTQPTMGGDGPSDIYLVREGVAPKLIAGGDFKQGHNSCPAFSPDGTKLAYATAEERGLDWENGAVVVIEVNDSGTRVGKETRIPVPEGLPCPTWSADGASLAYTTYGDLTVTRLGGDTTVLPPPSPGHHWGDYAWSPVDDLIAAIASDGIWLIPMGGGEPTLLREAAGGIGFLSWSPDGTRLAVTTEIVKDGSGSAGPVRIIRVDGTEPDREAGMASERVAWSPNGDRIAYIDGEAGLVIVDPDGGNPMAIPEIEDPQGEGTWQFGYAFKWSPDGRRMLSVARRNDWAVMSIAATGDPKPVVMTEESMDLYAIHTNDVSWQSVRP
jgi:Tol biopolymer transport system component